jgi:outer membrane protein assembly factor BamB
MTKDVCRHRWRGIAAAGLVVVLSASIGQAVTSKVTRQSSSKELLAGQSDGVVVTSRGTIELSRAAKVLASEFENVWSVNSIVVSGGTVFLGTSPNGHVYRYSLGKLTKIFPPEDESAAAKPQPAAAKSAEPQAGEAKKDDPAAKEASISDNKKKEDGKVIEATERLSNQHIFAMSMDVAGRLLAGISGDKCRLCRYEAGKMETVFEPNDAKYIFDIKTDNVGNIYLATGPQGRVYALDPSGKVAQLIYRGRDKNILSVAASRDGFIYAGCDTRGLVYKINPRNKTATVLYDSDEPEISALLALDGLTTQSGLLYAAATSASVVETEQKFAAQQAAAGRPESKKEEGGKMPAEGSMKLKVANTGPGSAPKPPQAPRPAPTPRKPGAASYIYKINKQGYISEVFSEAAVFLCVANQDGKILVGSGNEARLYSVDPETERHVILYEDRKASQISALAVSEQDIYVGTANPARLVLLSSGFATHGTYTSDLIDAGQPARWGKLQMDADIPRGCKILVAARSGNVKDVNDPTFSEWTEPVAITEPIQLRCPVGRFCQYRLTLETEDAQKTPVIREVAVASTVPNLAPRFDSIDVTRLQNPGKEGVFKISYKAVDENEDKLIYKLDFRKTGRTNWIQIKDKIEVDTVEWDSKTVEDGRYEIRVTASDERSNSLATRLMGSRISEPLVVDNTSPVIRKYSIEKTGRSATLKLDVMDELSVISKLEYTIDSNTEWKGSLPDDGVCDTTEESFTIAVEDIEPGEHVLALRIFDDVGNVTFKTFELSIQGK